MRRKSVPWRRRFEQVNNIINIINTIKLINIIKFKINFINIKKNIEI